MKLLHHSYSTNGDRSSGALVRIVAEDELFELCRGESKSEQPWRAKAERLLGKEDVGLGQCRQGVGRCDTPP